jgi:hypothetical protein
MGNTVYLILVVALFASCSTRSGKDSKSNPQARNNHNNDTIVGEKNLMGEIAGSALMTRANGYFIIVNNDTSGFMPIFSEFKENGEVNINLNLPYRVQTEFMKRYSLRKPKPYSRWFNELKIILPFASGNFNMDSLRSISLGRLILTGDLAIDITRQYKNSIGDNEKIATADYEKIERFLLETKLAEDFNELLRPYSLSLAKITVEKTFFTTKEDLLINSITETSPAKIPETILDCITWIIITKQRP